MELSKRLQAVADLVGKGMVLADIGTDHGYIPIYLIETQKCPKAYAMDINEGPLLHAKEHIREHGLEEKIEVRQSDGVKALAVGECESLIIAGMGGALTIKIMEDGAEVFQNLKEFVLQPQSEIEKVRQYLCENGYRIVEENMVLEDGKFYPMMKVVRGRDSGYRIEELRYGRYLLEQRHPVLKMYLEKEVKTKEMILKNLESEAGERIEKRAQEIREEIVCAKKALEVYL